MSKLMPASGEQTPDVPNGPVVVFEALFRDHSRSLLAYALRRVDRPEDAVDVVSETMLVAWRRLKEVPDGDEGRPWLFGVARNVLANQHRAGRRRGRLGSRLRERLSDIAIEDHADDVGTALIVRNALRNLGEDDREILRLVAWEGLTPTEVATAMSIPPATARTRLHRARARLREELESMGWTGERNTGAGHEPSDGQMLVRTWRRKS